MVFASSYKPMKNKPAKSKMPVEIIRCVDSNGKYMLLKKYRRKSMAVSDTFEQEPCKLDMPAKFKLSYDYNTARFEPNKDYIIQMIKYCVEKQNCNEYELRNLVMNYLKGMRKQMDKDKFKSVCNIFDKADKMLSRCDRRKNSNINEANVSYKFLVKSYSRIVDICEVKKKVVEDISITLQELATCAFNLWNQTGNIKAYHQWQSTMSAILKGGKV